MTPQAMLFGEGCQTVNLEKMASAVGSSPATLSRWHRGEYPASLRVFANICKIRRLTDEQIGQVIREVTKR